MFRVVHPVSVLVLVLGMTLPAAAATHTVMVGGAGGAVFSPADLTIQAGDTVHWDWDGGNHDVESGVGGVHDGNFDSGAPTADTSTTFDVTFDQAFLDANPMTDNVYPYYCSIHFGFGMVGSITVEQQAVPAVTEWGLVVLVILVLSAGTLVLTKRKTANG